MSKVDPGRTVPAQGGGEGQSSPTTHGHGGGRHSSGLLPFAGRRTLTSLGTVVFVVVFNFFLFRLLPGDPIGLFTRGRNVSVEQLTLLRDQLNQPLGEQFLHYVSNPFSSTLSSTKFNQPVWDVIGARVWPTVLLLGLSTLLSVVIGIRIGIRAGWSRGSRFDKGSTAITLVLYSMPEFWLGMLLLLAFGVGVGFMPGFLPINGMISPVSTPAPWRAGGTSPSTWCCRSPP